MARTTAMVTTLPAGRPMPVHQTGLLPGGAR
jgi:hypothetical protein